MTLKAFAVQEDCEGTGGIFYAKHAIEARKRGANEYGDGELGGITCRRAPWADAFAPGPCPPLVMIEHGWWWDCTNCGVRITDDYYTYDDDDNEVKLDPVDRGGNVYCSVECHLRSVTDKARRKMREAEAIEWLSLRLLHKLPNATLEETAHAYAKDQVVVQQCVIQFRFPGCKIGPASFRYEHSTGKAEVTVCYGDMPAFEAWQKAGYPETMPDVAVAA